MRTSPRFEAVRAVLRAVRPHEWGLLAALLVVTDRYRWMMDDAFIYFRYVDNLVFLGRGLVYNAGEFVEGFSSPLWLLLLVPLRALELDYYSLVRWLALAFAGSYGAALIWLNRQLSPPGAVVNFPLAASAAHYGLTTHFSSGLETPLVQLLAPLYAAALLRPASRGLQCVVALAPLIRAEAGLLWVLYLPYVVFRTRRVPWVFVGTALAANGGWMAFRVLYYADFLPNTFYLKDSEQWGFGLAYWRNVSATHRWSWVIGVLLVCAVVGRQHVAARLPRAMLAAGALAYGAYVARIGGDMLYHRYAALPVGLGLCASAGLVEAALLQLKALPRPQLMAAGIAFGVAGWFGYCYPPTLESHPLLLPLESRKAGVIADPNWHRRHKALEYNPARAAQDAERRRNYARLRANGEPARPLIRVTGFCQRGYELFDAYVVHDYGLTDLVLARLPRPFGRPGHKLVQVEAQSLAKLRQWSQGSPAPWFDQPRAPRWVRKNRDALLLLESKQHNAHDPRENLQLALSRPRLK